MTGENINRSLNLHKEKSCTDLMLDRFYGWGVDTIFFVPGAQVDFFLSRAAQDRRFKLVMAAHELGAGYMADGYSRISGRPAAAVSINGPGAYNFTAAAATARADQSRVIFITGDAPAFLNGYSAFQGSDDGNSNSKDVFECTLTHSFKIDSSGALADAIAFYEKILRSDIHCPVHFDLPCDFAKKNLSVDDLAAISSTVCSHPIFEKRSQPENVRVKQAVKTVILAGEEIRNDEDMASVASFSKKYSIPVAVTMDAKNMQPLIDKELFLGVFGYAGGKRSFDAIMDPDLEMLIILGASMNERNTAGWHKSFFSPGRNILLFSADESQGSNFHGYVNNFEMTPSEAAAMIDKQWTDDMQKGSSDNVCIKRSSWAETLMETPLLPEIMPGSSGNSDNTVDLSSVLDSLNTIAPKNSVLFLDSGDHRIYGAAFWEAKSCRSFFTAAKTAPLGWGICAAVGASFSPESGLIFVLTGDGCMMMHGMEIAAASRYGRRIIFLVSSNGAHGRIAARMSKQPYELKEMIAHLPKIDWKAFAESMNISARRVFTITEFKKAMLDAESCSGPFLIELMTTYENEPPYPRGLFSSTQLDVADIAFPQKNNDQRSAGK